MIHLRRLRANDFKQLHAVDLRFPRTGTFLVQGSNEAGKSTLFEAVFVALFGRPLDGKRLDECIRHGAEEAYLRLEVGLADGRALHVSRRLRRTRSVYALDIVGPDGAVEELRGGSVIADRIEAELGFDADAMLDTCFVEQKKLDKLEGMSLRDRERSLLKLLNLDRLQDLADELRVTRDDDLNRERLEGRRDLARIQAQLPQLESAWRVAAKSVARGSARDALRAARDERAALDALTAQAASAAAAAASLEGRAHAASAAADALRFIADARTALERAAEADETAVAVQRDVAAADAAVAEVPRITARGRALKRVRDRLACLTRLVEERGMRAGEAQAAEARLAELATLREQLNDTRRALVEARGKERDAEGALEESQADLTAFEVRAALVEWQAAQTGLAAVADPAPRIAEREGARAGVRRSAQVQLGSLGALAAAGLGSGVWLRNGALAGAPSWLPWLALGLGALASVLLIARTYGAWRRLDALTAEIARLRGEASVLEERRSALQERATGAERRLAGLRAAVPAGMERARESITALDDRIAGRDRAVVEQARDDAGRERAEATAAIQVLIPREAELLASAGPREATQSRSARDAAIARAERLDRFLARRRPRLEQAAELAGVPLALDALDTELGALRAELQAHRQRAAEAPTLRQRWQQAAQLGAQHRAAAVAAWQSVPARLAEHGAPPVTPESPGTPESGEAGPEHVRVGGVQSSVMAPSTFPSAEPTGAPGPTDAPGSQRTLTGSTDATGSPPSPITDSVGHPSTQPTVLPTADGVARARAAAEAAFQDAGGDAARAAYDEAGQRAAAVTARAAQAGERWVQVLRTVREQVAALEPALSLADDPAVPDLDQATTAVIEALGSDVPTANLAQRQERALRELDVARHERARLERALELPGEVLDLGACELALAATVRDHAVRRQARVLLDAAGRGVVKQVMPSTIEHMRRLLPTLTEGRYFDAQLADDYRIEVFDERAGDWLRKNLFSGGTRDQFSLALRLAFALATLPEERGVAPGFLFLDEPLSAFDEARARALIGLITEGEIAESFDQVFLISHVRVDPALFDYRVIMEDGRVQESTLPEPVEDPAAGAELDSDRDGDRPDGGGAR